MTQWHLFHGDILNVRADGLVCSANPDLNLSGGVGGAFSLRYGNEMQTFLHDYLREKNLRRVGPGEAVVALSCGSPFMAVAHAVAIDPFYDTNNEQILNAYQAAFKGLANAGCRTITAACLGCGYGRFPANQFSETIEILVAMQFTAVDDVTFATTDRETFTALATVIDH